MYCKSRNRDKYLIDISEFQYFDNIMTNNNNNIAYKVKGKNNEIFFAKTIQDNTNQTQMKFFTREIKLLMKVQHSTIIELKGFSYTNLEQQNKVTFLMKLMEKGDLSIMFDDSNNHFFNNTVRQKLFVGVAFAMMLLHKNHIIYRDLKPENILLYNDYSPCLTDFDLSKNYNPIQPGEHSQANIGTLFYLAPEVFKSEFYDIKADVYSFGVVMIEIISGERVFSKSYDLNNQRVFFDLASDLIKGNIHPEVPSNIKRQYQKLANLIEKCISSDPQKRPTFLELFKRLSLMQEDFFLKYKDKFDFLQDENIKIKQDKDYGLQGVDHDVLKSYIEKLLDETKPDKKIDDEKFAKSKEICQIIFCLGIENARIPPNINEKEANFLKNLMMFFPDQKEFELISRNIKNCSLKEFNDFFIFPVIYQNLEQIYANIKLISCDGYFEIYSFYAFFTWISFSFIILFEQQTVDMLPLLKIFNEILKATIEKRERISFREIAAFCFIDIIKLATNEGSFDDFNSIWDEIKKFFIESGILPSGSDEIFLTIFRKLIKPNQGLNNQEILLIDLIIDTFNRNPKNLHSDVIQSVIELLKDFILSFNDKCLSLFHRALELIDTNKSYEILSQLIDSFLIQYDDDESRLTTNDIEINVTTLNCDSDYFHPPNDLYQFSKIDIKDDKDYLIVNQLESFLKDEFKNEISILIDIAVANETIAQFTLDYLIDKIQNLGTETPDIFSYQKLALIFFFISLIFQKYQNITVQISKENFISFLFDSRIFDPNITYFNKHPNFDIVCSLRHFIIKYFSETLTYILENYSAYPHLLLELLYHVKLIFDAGEEIHGFWMCTGQLLRLFVIYRINSNTLDLSENDILFLTIRKTIYSFIEYFFVNLNLIKSNLFIEYCFILLLEPPIRKKMIDILFDKLNPNCEFGSLFYCMSKLFHVCCYEVQPNEGISLIYTIINYCIHNNSWLQFFMLTLMNGLCNDLLNISVESTEFQNVDNLVIILIEFIYQNQKKFDCIGVDLSLFELLISHFLPKLTITKIISKFIEIIADEKQSTISPTFEIKQSKFICSFVKIFFQTGQIYNILNFLSHLCDFSSENCIKCHDEELDLLIIDIITELRQKIYKIIPKKTNIITNYFDDKNNFLYTKDEHGIIINEESFDLLLHLFSQIASTVSSVPVITKYFLMLSPIDSNMFSLIHQKIINTLSEIMDALKKSPSAPFPMSSNMISIHYIPEFSVRNGFNFSFWISMSQLMIHDSITYDIFELNDSCKNIFKFSIINNSIFQVDIQSREFSHSCTFNVNIHYNKWIFLSVNYNVNTEEKKSNISIYIDQENIQTLTVSDVFFMPEKEIACNINGSNVKYPNPNFLGLFLLSKPLKNKEIKGLVIEGQRSLSTCIDKIIFAYRPRYNGHQIIFIPIIENYDIKNSFKSVAANQYRYSFFDLLLNHFDFNIIIPIFGQYNKKLTDGTQMNFINTIGVEILKKLFSLGEEYQISFHDKSCFYSISYYLLNLDKSNITFDLYKLHFNLFLSISYKNLQGQFIDAILMNFDIWSKSNIEDIQKIIYHWSYSFYPSYKLLIDSVRSTKWFIFTISECFDRSDPNEKVYLSCRHALYSIIEDNLSMNNILYYILQIIKKQSLMERTDMLDLIMPLFYKIDKSELAEIIQPLLLILDSDEIDDCIIKNIISLLISVYRSNTHINSNLIPLNAVIEYIVNALYIKGEYLISLEFFESFLGFIEHFKIPELLPILSISAIIGGSEYLDVFIKEIDLTLDYYTDEMSAIYPILLIFKYLNCEEYYHNLIEKEILMFSSHLIQFINTIDMIGYFYYDIKIYYQVKHDILNTILDKKSYQPNDCLSLFEIIRDFLFFKSKKQYQEITYSLYLISPFSDSNGQFNNFEKETNEIDIIRNLYKNIYLLTEIKKIFGLRFDKINLNNREKWLDLDLAKNTIYFFKHLIQLHKNGIISYENIKLINKTMNIISTFVHVYDSIFIDIEKAKIDGLIILDKYNEKYINKIETEMTRSNENAQMLINFAKQLNSLCTFYTEKIFSIQKFYLNYSNDFEGIDTLRNKIIDEYLTLIDSVTKYRSAWSELKQINQNEKLKRDNTLCASYCPFKVKVKEISKNKKPKDSTFLENDNSEFSCKIIKIKEEKEASFSMNAQSINITTKNDVIIIDSYDIDSILYAYERSSLSGFQIFTKSGKNFELLFKSDYFIKLIESFKFMGEIDSSRIQSTNIQAYIISSHITDMWCEGKMSNFEYLINLNIFSGRSFNDINQYPVFPWIIADYESSTIDLLNPKTFRDLSKPIGAINDQRLNEIRNKNHTVLYKSGYSNRHSVLFYLYRLEPFFTKRQNIKNTALEYSTSNFNSISETFTNATTKINDYRELIPEFFFLPEFLTSKELGDVKLPPWANHSAIEFIYLNRKALESDFASMHLNEWIDLIWGNKQNSIEENNVFSSNLSRIELGQVPIKLFTKKHPSKDIINLKRDSFYQERSNIPLFKNNNARYAIIKFKNLHSKISSAFVSLKTGKTSFEFKLIGSNGMFYSYSVNFTTPNFIVTAKTQKDILNIKCDQDDRNTTTEENKSIISPKFIDSNLICYIDKNYESVKIVNCQNWEINKISKQSFRIISIETNSEDLLAVSSSDSSVTIYDADFFLNSKPLQLLSKSSIQLKKNLSLSSFKHVTPSLDKIPIPLSKPSQFDADDSLASFYSFRDFVVCFAFSKPFKTLICGTNDNYLLFCQMDQGKISVTRSIKMKEKPLKIVVTENFGFVAVLTVKNKRDFLHQKLTLFNINGGKIRSLKLENSIVEMICSFSSPGGFDFLIAADKENHIFVFEAFYLNFGEPVFTCRSNIIKLAYIKEESLIIAFCDDGTATVIFHPLIG